MSVWTEVKGVCWINKDSKFSLRKYISDNFSDVIDIALEQQVKSNQRLSVNFSFTFNDDGVSAALALNAFVAAIKQADKNSIVDITANIRFIG